MENNRKYKIGDKVMLAEKDPWFDGWVGEVAYFEENNRYYVNFSRKGFGVFDEKQLRPINNQ